MLRSIRCFLVLSCLIPAGHRGRLTTRTESGVGPPDGAGTIDGVKEV